MRLRRVGRRLQGGLVSGLSEGWRRKKEGRWREGDDKRNVSWSDSLRTRLTRRRNTRRSGARRPRKLAQVEPAHRAPHSRSTARSGSGWPERRTLCRILRLWSPRTTYVPLRRDAPEPVQRRICASPLCARTHRFVPEGHAFESVAAATFVIAGSGVLVLGMNCAD